MPCVWETEQPPKLLIAGFESLSRCQIIQWKLRFDRPVRSMRLTKKSRLKCWFNSNPLSQIMPDDLLVNPSTGSILCRLSWL